MSNGYNKLRWDCDKDGCFNTKRRPKIEEFAVCFPRTINFGDVDGLVELSGKFCLLEWKGDGGSVKTGQRISYETFTRIEGNIVFVVNGDAETMEVRSYSLFWKGRHYPTIQADLSATQQRIKQWADWAAQRKAAA